jgi:DNA polymerase/3'-5' exonuclease PolX
MDGKKNRLNENGLEENDNEITAQQERNQVYTYLHLVHKEGRHAERA